MDEDKEPDAHDESTVKLEISCQYSLKLVAAVYFIFLNFSFTEVQSTHKTVINLSKYSTFSSKALWCSNKDFSALRTSTSLDTPEGDWACRFTTVILSDLSCRDTRHSKCSSNSYWA